MNLSKTTYYILLGCAFILGVVAYIVRFTAYAGDEYKVQQEILSIVGNILTVGVVVGFFTTVIQNFGFFKEELGKVIFDKKFLANRKDIREIWLNASKVVLEGKFPQIQDDFLERMIDYLQCKEVLYYNNHETHIIIEWASSDRTTIRVKKIVLFELIASKKSKQYYTYSTWTTVKPGDKYSCNLSIYVNNHLETKNFLNPYQGYDNGEKWHKMKVRLKGCLKYKIRVIEEKEYNINSDFMIGFRAKHLTNNLRVQVIHPSDIDVEFAPCGTQMQFDEVNKTETMNENYYHHVILPKQGFYIALKPKIIIN